MRFLPPIKGIGTAPGVFISQRYGESLIDYSQFGLVAHNGWDIAAPKGTFLYAVHDGWTIEQTAKETGFGLRYSMRIEADGKYYLVVYGHLDRLENPVDVPYNWSDKSRPVKAGGVIGYVDSTGFSKGHHLHLGVYEQLENGTRLNQNNGYGGAIDPLPFLEGNNMRLVKDGNTTYLVAGIANKIKLGIADIETLDLFGDEPVETANTNGIPETYTISKGFILNKKGD